MVSQTTLFSRGMAAGHVGENAQWRDSADVFITLFPPNPDHVMIHYGGGRGLCNLPHATNWEYKQTNLNFQMNHHMTLNCRDNDAVNTLSESFYWFDRASLI